MHFHDARKSSVYGDDPEVSRLPQLHIGIAIPRKACVEATGFKQIVGELGIQLGKCF